jgi:hypothetical protein
VICALNGAITVDKEIDLEEPSNSGSKSEPTAKRAKSGSTAHQDTKEVLAELVRRLRKKLNQKVADPAEVQGRDGLRPNLDRLTVGVDLGDQRSNYCILDLQGKTLVEGKLRTTQTDFAEFFQALSAARVVVEVGTDSAWVREVIRDCGHDMLVANPRLMERSKRRKRKSDRIDAHKLARRIGRPNGSGQ